MKKMVKQKIAETQGAFSWQLALVKYKEKSVSVVSLLYHSKQ
jgi:hypothetical protein